MDCLSCLKKIKHFLECGPTALPPESDHCHQRWLLAWRYVYGWKQTFRMMVCAQAKRWPEQLSLSCCCLRVGPRAKTSSGKHAPGCPLYTTVCTAGCSALFTDNLPPQQTCKEKTYRDYEIQLGLFTSCIQRSEYFKKAVILVLCLCYSSRNIRWSQH